MQGQDRFFVFTIFLVVVFSIFQSVEALTCYNCTSASKTCGKEQISEEVLTCSGIFNTCVSFIIDDVIIPPSVQNSTYIHLPQNLGQKVTVRSCSVSNFCKSVADLFPNCKECSTDMCNASATNTVSTVIMITSGLITLLWTIQ